MNSLVCLRRERLTWFNCKCDLHEIYEHLDTYILTSLEVSAQLERVLMTLLSLCSETRTKYFHSYLQQRRQSQE